ncbi:MAG: alpha-L-fucosidase [Lentisphaeraceae bacterium]|nr:alpha-L-fucosidase [Lentisphaeraceae bacterium]
MLKNIQKYTILICLALLTACSSVAPKTDNSPAYQENWESLSQYNEAPDWFRDAKFGVYCHWGVYTVPEMFTEWYPRSMFDDASAVQKFHSKKYGNPADFPYHKMVPLFTAPKFNAAEWATVFKSSGAKFAGSVTEHHDGFAMWDSKLTPWNAAQKGPKKDIFGELSGEIKKRDMKLISTFHHARNLQRNGGDKSVTETGQSYDSHYIYDKRYATSSTDPELRLLYGNLPVGEFNELWFGKLKEVIDNYSPDIIYFDSWLNLIPEKYRQKFCAYYFNEAQKSGKQVVTTFKQHDLPIEVGIHDIERGGHIEIFEQPWMSDDSVCFNSWSYAKNDSVKPSSMVLHSLIDIVSKNGNLLLNIAPRADGSIPADQKKLLQELGDWLGIYGEAIYATRPWEIHGFGPTAPKFGRLGGMSTINYYTAEDCRFTMAKDKKAIYVIVLGEPKAGTKMRIKYFAPHRHPTPSAVKKVIELSTGKEVQMDFQDNAAYLHFPALKYNKMANVFKIVLE